MKTSIFFLLLTLTSTALAGVYPAKFKGIKKIEAALSARIGASDGSFDLGSYLGVPIQRRQGSLLGLLGTIRKGEFKNGDPNGINFLLWYLVFDSFAKELVLTCKGLSPGNLSDPFRIMLTELCATEDWTAPLVQENLLKVWTEIMSYEAPDSERVKWVQEMILMESSSNAEKIKFGLVLVFMNPYFILEE